MCRIQRGYDEYERALKDGFLERDRLPAASRTAGAPLSQVKIPKQLAQYQRSAGHALTGLGFNPQLSSGIVACSKGRQFLGSSASSPPGSRRWQPFQQVLEVCIRLKTVAPCAFDQGVAHSTAFARIRVEIGVPGARLWSSLIRIQMVTIHSNDESFDFSPLNLNTKDFSDASWQNFTSIKFESETAGLETFQRDLSRKSRYLNFPDKNRKLRSVRAESSADSYY